MKARMCSSRRGRSFSTARSPGAPKMARSSSWDVTVSLNMSAPSSAATRG